MRKNYKLTICYDGTRYYGWEHKEGRDTIQGKLTCVLERLTGNEDVHIIGAGRTDAGVHAKEMVANVWLDTDMMPDELKDTMNHYLPSDIAITDLCEMDDRFHARYQVIGKTYCYTLYIGEEKPVFDRNFVWQVTKEIDIDKMKKAAEYLLGTHDFAVFCKRPQKKKSTVRTVDSILFDAEGDYLKIFFTGNGFLYHMVRIMTGTIVEAGLGRIEPTVVKEALETGNRELITKTAPAQGLCLSHIDYPAR